MPPLTTVSVRKANDLFTAISQENCDVNAMCGDCIPFLYPNDGCQARTHRMCQLLANLGVTAGKIRTPPSRVRLLAMSSATPMLKNSSAALSVRLLKGTMAIESRRRGTRAPVAQSEAARPATAVAASAARRLI
jgi:hypothetical protein